MAPRRDVALGLRPAVFTPAAAPVNRTVQAGPSPLRDLAGALSQGSDTLRRFALDTADRQKDKLTAQAEDDVAQWMAMGKDSAAAISEGLIPPGASLVYRYAAREAYGRLEATRFGTQLLGQVDAALTESNGNLTFEAFMQEHLASVLPDNPDEAYRQGFFRNVEAQVYNARQKFASKQAEVAEASAGETMQAEMSEALQNVFVNAPEGQPDPAAFTMNLQAIGRRSMAVNPLGGTAVNRAMTTAVMALATDHEDPTLIDTIGDGIVLPNGTKLSSQTYFRDAADRARSDITRTGQQKDAARDRQISQEVEDSYSRLIDAQAQGQLIDWDAERLKLRSNSTAFNVLRQRFAQATDTIDDDHLVEEFTTSIINGDGVVNFRRIASAVGAGLSPRTASALAAQLRTTTRYMNEMPAQWRRNLSDGERDARQMATAGSGGGAFALISPSNARKANELALQYRTDFLQFYGENRTKPEADVLKWRTDWLTRHRNLADVTAPVTPPPTMPKEQVNLLVSSLTIDLADGELTPEMEARLRRAGIQDITTMRDPAAVRRILSPTATTP